MKRKLEDDHDLDPPSKRSARHEESSDDDDDVEDHDWETVEVPDTDRPVYHDVEVVFEAPRAVLKKSKWEAAYERNLREWMHNCHVTLLIAHYMIRNAWCSNKEVQSVCLSIVPEHIQNQLQDGNTSDVAFQTGIKWLLAWWKTYFNLTGTGLVTRAYDEYAFLMDADLTRDDNSIEASLAVRDIKDSENILSMRDFVEKLVVKSGYRDTSAQLFVAILRALSIDARLVCSLQPIPYRIPAKRSEPDKASVESNDTGSKADDEEKSKVKLRRRGPRLGSPKTTLDSELKAFHGKPPIIWAEVYNKHQDRWVCLDPIRGLYDQPKAMAPSSGDRRNQMAFVLAFPADKDGCIDVTRRYASHMGKSLRLRERELTRREKEAGMQSWWEPFYQRIRRKRWGDLEEREQQDLENLKAQEPMPTSIQAFNNHPLYALERHLKKFEVIYPQEPVLGHIKGEKIFPRSCVKPVHTAETWMKQGKVIKDGEQPIKHVNARAVTAEKKRAQELARLEGETLQVGCYGEWQTTPYVPPPVVDGKVPRNAYGRVDLFTPEMLPAGAAHIPIQGISRIARKLGIDFCEAVVDFEFVKRRSVPVTNGIVVAEEYKDILLEAWHEYERNEANKAIQKQEKEVYARWRKLILGVLIKERLVRDYGQSSAEPSNEKPESKWDSFLRTMNRDRTEQDTSGGGFIREDTEGGFLDDHDDDME